MVVVVIAKIRGWEEMKFNKSAKELIAQTQRLIDGSKNENLKNTLRESLKLRLLVRELF